MTQVVGCIKPESVPIPDSWKKIKAFAFDVDGVFTDGGLLAFPNGDLYRTFDAKDAFAVRMAAMHGYKLAVITGGRDISIRKRFLTCGIPEEDVYLGSRDKLTDFDDFCRKYSLAPEEVMYFGDDLPDVPVLEACGVGVCPNDADRTTLQSADYVSPYPGGKRCIRHTIETLMTAKGEWSLDIALYVNKF